MALNTKKTNTYFKSISEIVEWMSHLQSSQSSQHEQTGIEIGNMGNMRKSGE